MKDKLMIRLGKSAVCFVFALTVMMSCSSCEGLDDFLEIDSDTASQTQADSKQINTSVNSDKDTLTVSYIDVGQGDSILLQCGSDAMLIDAGENDKGNVVVGYLSSHGIKKLKYAVGTHPHSDHIGGMDTVMDSIKTQTFICPETTYQTATWKSVLKSAENTGAKTVFAVPDRHYKLGKADCVIYAPQPDSIYSSANNYSVVMKVTYGKRSFLFTGDAEKISEDEMLSHGYDLSADVLKVGHHGSVSSTSEKFFKAVDPQYAVISCGVGNEYGHPHRETLTALKKAGVETLRTDKLGNIVMTTDGKGIEVKTDKNAYTQADNSAEYRYIGNKNSYKFHKNDCSSVKTISSDNRVYFIDRKSAVKQGYKPCGSCKP